MARFPFDQKGIMFTLLLTSRFKGMLVKAGPSAALRTSTGTERVSVMTMGAPPPRKSRDI